MILRRPYAFLVKHFKLIHTILLLGSVFVMYKTFNLVSFFGSYIRDVTVVNGVSNLSSKYVTYPTMFVTIFIILVNGIIIYLLRYKGKPYKMYLIMSLYHIVLLLLLFWMRSFVGDLPYTSPDIRFISIIRDIFRFSIIVDIGVIVVCFVRAIGFDVTKFDFKKDLLELGVEEEDNEEYEFEFKFDKDKIKSQIKKKIRYTKYFYKENKAFFNTVALVIVGIIAISVVKIFFSFEKVYKENQSFVVDDLNIKVLESYKTRTNNFGNRINTDYFYVIAKMEITNNGDYEASFGNNMIKVAYSDYELTSYTTTENSKFTEFGEIYFNQIIRPSETRTFNFIFEIPIEFYYEDFTLKYLYDITYDKNNEMKYEYKKVSLSPKTFNDEAKKVKTVNLGEELSFEDSVLGNTKITISSMSLNDIYYYDIYKCYNKKCEKTTKSVNAKTAEKFDLTLLKILYKIEYDYDTLGSKYTNNEFISKFCNIRFEVNGKEYNNRIDLEDMTPYYSNDYSLIQVRDKLKKAEKIYLDFYIRDKIYTYIIKDNSIPVN